MSPLLPQARRLIAAACLLFLASGAWFGLVAARAIPASAAVPVGFPVHETLARVSSELVATRFRADTLYQQAREADKASSHYAELLVRAEGKLNQCGTF